MERKLFEVGNILINDGGVEVVVYEVTEQFAFVAPFVRKDGKIIIVTQKTVVYENDESNEVIEPVRTITIDDEQPAGEVVEAEVIEEPAAGNEAADNWAAASAGQE